ncbi:MAG: alpha/beta hydrolase [Brevundimonas sp.]|uniref:alpha/beta fold hydrolase n=1 Tax=Brevundimonas sp. TaxID=1871086 RepID=UPI0025BB0172|nr:alpha/beta hydrolase [Brevundimonas sp.]MBX3476883.1 alpha/beta hydrolase [Brevundimonas sp.]
MKTHVLRTATLNQSVIEAGTGPLVVLIHGFPELGLSWRAQIEALAGAGYRVVAPDMRGYGGTDRPEGDAAYSILHLVGDMVALVQALGETRAVVVGHDWGAPVAWHCALLRPDVFRAVAGLSVPFQPRSDRGPPIAAMKAITRKAGLGDLYIARFQEAAAQAEFDADPETALRKVFWAYDGAPTPRATGFIPPGRSLLQTLPDDAPLPPSMTPGTFARYVEAFRRTGFGPAFAWYRCLDLNWSLTAFAQGLGITVPALFMVGETDPVRHYAGRHEASLGDWAPDLRGSHIIPGAGHWLQQERPEAVNRLLLDFLSDL